MSGIEPWLAAMAAPAGGTAAATGTAAAGSAAAAAGGLAGGATAAGLESLAAGSFASTAATIESAAAAQAGIGATAAGIGKELGKGALMAGAASALAPKPSIPGAVRQPTVDEARQRVEMQDRLMKKKGNAASILTGKLGDTTAANTATKQLLGQ